MVRLGPINESQGGQAVIDVEHNDGGHAPHHHYHHHGHGHHPTQHHNGLPHPTNNSPVANHSNDHQASGHYSHSPHSSHDRGHGHGHNNDHGSYHQDHPRQEGQAHSKYFSSPAPQNGGHSALSAVTVTQPSQYSQQQQQQQQQQGQSQPFSQGYSQPDEDYHHQQQQQQHYQQQEYQQQQQHYHQPIRKTTRVDGIGIWRSWKRNFSTPLLALLDLIDNSLDAAIASQFDLSSGSGGHNNGGERGGFIGRVHIFPDVHHSPDNSNNSNTNNATNTTTTATTGVCILNNSHKPIRPLIQVLEVYNSSKIHSGAGDIGENGVGLKQGCATLSELSFVLVKNGGNDRIELGIVAESLQRVEGCYLPAFQFDNSGGPNNPSLKQQMHNLFNHPDHSDVRDCIAQYGKPKSINTPNLSLGIRRLCQKFDHMCYNFHNNDYVFALILDKVVHGMNNERTGPANEHEHKIRVNEYMKTLQKEIPKQYLHIPDDFEFIIDGHRLPFKYWTERLVEFTSFAVTVSKKQPWMKGNRGFEDWENQVDSYKMRVLVGFDKERVVVKDEKKEASLYIYSRQSGRLIKVVGDARTDLSLSAGGTEFCQGLTIIVDDIEGHLPLNPTKQDVAFGEESSGGTHKENLYQCIGGVTCFYYKYHLDKYGGRKKDLTRQISKLADLKSPSPFKSVDSSILTTFENMVFKRSNRNMRVDRDRAKEVVGRDTVFRLERETQRGQKRSLENANQYARAQPQPQHRQFGMVNGFIAPLPIHPPPTQTMTCQPIPRRFPPSAPVATACVAPVHPPRSNPGVANTTATASSSRVAPVARGSSQPVQVTSSLLQAPDGIHRNWVDPTRNDPALPQPVRSSAQLENQNREAREVTRESSRRRRRSSSEDEDENDAIVEAPSMVVSGEVVLVDDNDLSDDGENDANESNNVEETTNEATSPEAEGTETVAYYKDLCNQLTDRLENERQRKKENKTLKKENAALKDENTKLKEKVAELMKMMEMMNRREIS